MEEVKIPPELMNMTADEMKERLEYMRGQEVKLHATYTEGSKGLTLLNSGAVAAMLAMSQALIGREVFTPFKFYALGALLVFLIGAISASSVFFALVYRITGSIAITPTGGGALKFATAALMSSMACFIAGSLAFILGIMVAY